MVDRENLIVRLSQSNLPNLAALLLAVVYLQNQIEASEEGIRRDMNQGFADVRADVTSFQGDIGALQVDVAGLQADVAGLQQGVGRLEDSVYELNGRVSKIGGAIAIGPDKENSPAQP